ncbi:hypothetical protein FH5_04050 [Priestia endophytica]|nr:hypothetical protein FH5_04050 [Priestia endophytica]
MKSLERQGDFGNKTSYIRHQKIRLPLHSEEVLFFAVLM